MRTLAGFQTAYDTGVFERSQGGDGGGGGERLRTFPSFSRYPLPWGQFSLAPALAHFLVQNGGRNRPLERIIQVAPKIVRLHCMQGSVQSKAPSLDFLELLKFTKHPTFLFQFLMLTEKCHL